MIIFEGTEEQFKQFFDEDYVVFTDEVAANFFDEEWGVVSSKYDCNYLVVDNYNLSVFADYEFMYKMMKRVSPLFYKFASKQIQEDVKLIKLVITNEPAILIDFDLRMKYASPLEYIPEKYRDNEEIITIAMENDPTALQFASFRLKNSREFVIKAIDINPYQFVYASEDLRNDKEMVLYAIKDNYGWSYIAFYDEEKKYLYDFDGVHIEGYEIFEHVSKRLKLDREFILEVLKYNGRILTCLDNSLRLDRELILTAVSSPILIFEYLDPLSQDDEEIASLGVRKSGYSIRYASERLKGNKNIARLAIDNDYSAIEYIAYELLDDPDILHVHLKSWEQYCQKPGTVFLHFPMKYYDNPEGYKVCCITSFGIDYSDKDIIFSKNNDDPSMTEFL
ncbi:MAG: DUF4116 domain-containing protein [Neisseriales bacterium]|nr:MAG: DUF4116 domain-containing protein [Neisseriales bacterium]